MSAILRVKDKNGKWVEIPAIQGDDGKSAYEVAVANGFEGSEKEWLESLKVIPAPTQIEVTVEDGSTKHLSVNIPPTATVVIMEVFMQNPTVPEGYRFKMNPTDTVNDLGGAVTYVTRLKSGTTTVLFMRQTLIKGSIWFPENGHTVTDGSVEEQSTVSGTQYFNNPKEVLEKCTFEANSRYTLDSGVDLPVGTRFVVTYW